MNSAATHTGFPLAPLDAQGVPLAPGCLVKLLSVASCLTELPEEDQARLVGLIGQVRTVVGLDGYGFVWLSFSATQPTADFCLFPSEVECVGHVNAHNQSP